MQVSRQELAKYVGCFLVGVVVAIGWTRFWSGKQFDISSLGIENTRIVVTERSWTTKGPRMLWLGSVDIDPDGKPTSFYGKRQRMVTAARQILAAVHER